MCPRKSDPRQTTFTYDGDGNLCKATLPVANASGTTATVQYRYDEFLGTYSCSATFTRFPNGKNLRTAEVDAEGRTTTYSYFRPDPANPEQESPNATDTVPWLKDVTMGAGTADAATTSFTYYRDSARPWEYGQRATKVMPNGNAGTTPACVGSCTTADFTITYAYWGPSDTYTFTADPTLENVSQQGWLKSTSQPGDTRSTT